MLGTTPEDLAQFLHQEERLDSVKTWILFSFSAKKRVRIQNLLGLVLMSSVTEYTSRQQQYPLEFKNLVAFG